MLLLVSSSSISVRSTVAKVLLPMEFKKPIPRPPFVRPDILIELSNLTFAG